MRILVVSLLRLGDLIMIAPVIQELKRRMPESRIDLLINDSCRGAVDLISHVDHFFYFDRDQIQKTLGSFDRSPLEGYHRINELIVQLKEQNYERVINLTHNQLSGWIATAVGAPVCFGVHYDENDQRFRFGSSWFQFLNETADPTAFDGFHLVDVFKRALGLPLNELPSTSEKKNLAHRNLILFQPFSSEIKKTLSPVAWGEMGQRLRQLFPDLRIGILGSLSESAQVGLLCERYGFQPLVCDLKGVRTFLQQAKLLITCDTSVKHLATLTDVEVLELSLGSSHFMRTGCYKTGATILQASTPCAPCLHRTPCSQSTHVCGDLMTPEFVASTAGCLLSRDRAGLCQLAREGDGELKIFQTTRNELGEWMAAPVTPEWSYEDVCQLVVRACQNSMLEHGGVTGRKVHALSFQHLAEIKKDVLEDRLAITNPLACWLNYDFSTGFLSSKQGRRQEILRTLDEWMTATMEGCDEEWPGRACNLFTVNTHTTQ